MSDEQDSWFKSAFGVDLGEAATRIENEASALAEDAKRKAGEVIQGVQHAVEGGIDGVVSGIAGAVSKAAGVVGTAATGVAKKAAEAAAAAGAAAGVGSFPLRGSVGRGGQNAAEDVRAVQGALGITADGACGPQTTGAIEAFQRTMGVAKPDGRVDAGGATERAMRGGGAPSAPASPVPDAAAAPDAAGPLDRLQDGAAGTFGGVMEAGGEIIDRATDFVDENVPGAKEFRGRVAEAVDDGVEAAEGLAKKVVEGAKKALDDPKVLLDEFPADAGPADAGPADAGAADAGTQPDPIFDDIDKPFNVRADDPVEFVNKGNEYLGRGIAGHMKTDTLTIANADTDAKGKVIRANLRVRTTTERPHWIAGRPIGDEKAVIEQAEELIRGHEERHREIMKNGMRSAVAEMRGKTTAQADKILVKWIGRVDAEQDALDVREGKIDIIQSGGRITGARLVPR